MADQCFGDALLLSSLPFARRLTANDRIKLMKVANLHVVEKGHTFSLPANPPFIVVVNGALRTQDLTVDFCRGDAFGYHCYLDVSSFGPLEAVDITTLALIPREHCAILDELPPASLWICEFMFKLWNSHFEAGPVAALQWQLKRSLLEQMDAFRVLSARALETIVPYLTLKRWSAGDAIQSKYMNARDARGGSNVLFVVRGAARGRPNGSSAEIRLREGEQYPQKTAMLFNGHVSSNLAHQLPPVTFSAETDLVALSIGIGEYLEQMRLEELRVVFASPCGQRSAADMQAITSRFKFPLFTQLPASASVLLAGRLKLRVASEGQVVVARNDRPNRCFVVLSGELDFVGDDGAVLQSVCAGEMCGSTCWLLGNTPARFELRARRSMEFLMLHRDAVQSILDGKQPTPDVHALNARQIHVPVDRRDFRQCDAILDALLHASCLAPGSCFRDLPGALQRRLASVATVHEVPAYHELLPSEDMPFFMVLSGSVSWHPSGRSTISSQSVENEESSQRSAEQKQIRGELDIIDAGFCADWEHRGFGQCVRVSTHGGFLGTVDIQRRQFRYRAREPATTILQFDTGVLLCDTGLAKSRGQFAALPRKQQACIEACSILMDERFSNQLAENRAMPRMDMERKAMLLKHALGVLLEPAELLRVTQRAKPQRLLRGDLLHCDDCRIIILEGSIEVYLDVDSDACTEPYAMQKQCIGHLSTADSCGVTSFSAGAHNDTSACTLRCGTDVVLLRVRMEDVVCTRIALEKGRLQSAAVEAFKSSRVLEVRAPSPSPSEPELDADPGGPPAFITSLDVFATTSTDIKASGTPPPPIPLAAPVVHPLSSPRVKPPPKKEEKNGPSEGHIKPVTLFFKRVLNGVGKNVPKQIPVAKEGTLSKTFEVTAIPALGQGKGRRGGDQPRSRRASTASSIQASVDGRAAQKLAPAVDLDKFSAATEETRALRPSVPTGARRMRVQQQWRKTGSPR